MEHVKIRLPGESAWAEVLERVGDGRVIGRIDNKLFHEYSETERARWLKDNFGTVESIPKLHDYRFNDIVVFEKDGDGCWVPAEDHCIGVPND